MGDTITAAELRKGAKRYMIVDVREPSEFAESSIPGARNIPLGQLMAKEPQKMLPKDKEIVVHCRSGIRGEKACNFLKARGYKVKNLEGGILAWHGSV